MMYNSHRNPTSGRPSTLYQCGHWNDWYFVPARMYCRTSQIREFLDPSDDHTVPTKLGQTYDKPHQCEECGRQLKERIQPDRKHPSGKQQKELYGQKSLEGEFSA